MSVSTKPGSGVPAGQEKAPGCTVAAAATLHSQWQDSKVILIQTIYLSDVIYVDLLRANPLTIIPDKKKARRENKDIFLSSPCLMCSRVDQQGAVWRRGSSATGSVVSSSRIQNASAVV